MEQCYIALYDTTNRNKGYNITLGGEGICGYKHTKEARKKMSEARKGKKNPKMARNVKNKIIQELKLLYVLQQIEYFLLLEKQLVIII